MKNKKIDFRTSFYFPQMVNVLGVILILSGVALVLTKRYTEGVICIVSGTIILTTSYRLEIDLGNKTYNDYVWFLGMKNGKAERYENIEYLFIKKSKQSQQLNSRVSSTTITKDVFDGYLKFSEKEKIHLFTNESKSALVSRLRRIAQPLHLKIVDYSMGEPAILK